MCELSPYAGDRRSPADTRFLADVRPWMGGLSLEAIGQLRNHAWMTSAEESLCGTRLHSYLLSLASQHLEIDGTRLRLRSSDHDIHFASDGRADAERAMHYRILTLQLPPDLMISALCADERCDAVVASVLLTTPGLHSVLERPVAQTHLHIGASVPFLELWSWLMARLRNERLDDKRLVRDDARPFGGGRAFHSRLLQAALLRILLGAYVTECRRRPDSLRGFMVRWLRERWDRCGTNGAVGEAYQLLTEVLASLKNPYYSCDDIARLRGLYAAITRTSRHCDETCRFRSAGIAGRRGLAGLRSAARCPSELSCMDPLHDVLPTFHGQPPLGLPEIRFTTQALRLLSTSDVYDREFECTFWQYQRIRCIGYAYLVEGPETSGLDWFVRHYDRIRAFRGGGPGPAIGMEIDSRDANIASFEVRTSPKGHLGATRELLRSLTRQAAEHEPLPGRSSPEFGIVLHFQKRREDSKAGMYLPRHARWYLEQRRRARSIAQTLDQDPRLLLVLRGIDVCGVELAQPTWVLPSLFGIVRRASEHASRHLAVRYPSWRVTPIRATCHVGEEFRRLSEGLRHMHEVVQFGVLHRGDRVGHGLALAVDPDLCAEMAPTVVQPRQERLDDLLWEMDRYAEGDWEADVSRVELVREEILRIAQAIFGLPQAEVEQLRKARRLRHSSLELDGQGYPHSAHGYDGVFQAKESSHSARDFLRAYLFDPIVRQRGATPIEVRHTLGELKMLKAAQNWLRRLYANSEITIECNPSSNLVIGHYSDLREHPALRLRPARSDERLSGEPISLSINTDDPTTFATCLADEYAHLYFALLGARVESRDALAWLDAVRESGWRSRFTLDASRDRNLLSEVGKPRPV